jgi:hypothetical protein
VLTRFTALPGSDLLATVTLPELAHERLQNRFALALALVVNVFLHTGHFILKTRARRFSFTRTEAQEELQYSLRPGLALRRTSLAGRVRFLPHREHRNVTSGSTLGMLALWRSQSMVFSGPN